MAKRRAFSAEPSGVAIERLMDESGMTYRGLATKTDLSGLISQPPRPRKPAGAVQSLA